ncbi:MAG TPA: DUF4032 domain-containing protein [Candidatus Hydromicrobium sp.]
MNDIRTEAKSEFESARFRVLFNNLKSYISGKENKLLSFEEISKGLNLHNQKYLGIKTVDIDDIVGSIDRYKDFDRHFLPRKTNLEHRWSNIYSAYKKNIDLPLVKLYKAGNIYFVLDGNHRVSVAKRMGMKYIDAEVTEFTTKIPISREMDPIDMFILAEREKFLNLTKLKENRPDIKIRLTIPGKYDFLLEQINNHMYNLNKNIKEKEITFEEAAADWYDNIYLPAINIIERYKIIENFPNRTKSDLYVWIVGHKYYLKNKYGKDIGLTDAAYDFSTRYSEGFWPKAKLITSNFFKKLRLKKNENKRL